ncbi:hypothetical protein ASD89_11965 [Caulobacter sp. Root656]|nr:hypothetical protein ASD89_11965 [Caulobacter sp. Root656]
MKTTFGAILAGVLVLTASSALAASGDRTTPAQATAEAAPQAEGPATLDERLGCGVMLVTIDEVLQRNPQLAAKFSQGNGAGAAMVPMFKLLGVSGGQVLDKAYAEGVAQGSTPSTLYRRGVAALSAKINQDGGGKDQAMAVFSRCMSVAAPQS